MKRLLLTAAALALLLTGASADELGLRPNDGSDTLACRSASGALTPHISAGAAAAMPQLAEKLRRKDEAERQRSQASCDQIKAEAAVRQRDWDARAEQQRQAMIELAKRQAQRAQQQASEQQEIARQAAMPINRLLLGYRLYHYVSVCNQAREGFLVTSVNDVELERGRKAVKAIEARALNDDPSIDTDNVWQTSLKQPYFGSIHEEVCRAAIVRLVNSSPQPVWNTDKP
jgi:hypothetical protein